MPNFFLIASACQRNGFWFCPASHSTLTVVAAKAARGNIAPPTSEPPARLVVERGAVAQQSAPAQRPESRDCECL